MDVLPSTQEAKKGHVMGEFVAIRLRRGGEVAVVPTPRKLLLVHAGGSFLW